MKTKRITREPPAESAKDLEGRTPPGPSPSEFLRDPRLEQVIAWLQGKAQAREAAAQGTSEDAQEFRKRTIEAARAAAAEARRDIEAAAVIWARLATVNVSLSFWEASFGPRLLLAHMKENLEKQDPRRRQLPAIRRRPAWARQCHAWAATARAIGTADLELARAWESAVKGDAEEACVSGMRASFALARAADAFGTPAVDARGRAAKSNLDKHSPLKFDERMAIGKVAYEKLTIHLSAGVSPNDARARAYQAAQEWGEAEYGKQETGGRMTRRSNVYPKRYMVEYAKASGVSIPTAANRGGEQS